MFKSIRWQLSLSYAAIALLAALALGAVLISILRGYYAQREVDYLQSNAKAIGQFVMTGGTWDLPQPALQAQAESLAFLVQARVRLLDKTGGVVADTGHRENAHYISVASLSSPSATSDIVTRTVMGPKPLVLLRSVSGSQNVVMRAGISGEAVALMAGQATTGTQSIRSTVLFSSAPEGEATTGTGRANQAVRYALIDSAGQPAGYVELSEGPAYGREIVDSVAQGLAVAGVVAVLLATGAGWLASRRIGAPLQVLARATERMAGGDLAARAATSRHAPAELDLLSVSFNQMACQVEETVSTLRRFVSDAAHELNTPLTALRTNLELAAGDTELSHAQLPLQRALTQVQRLDELTRNLLELSRIEAGAAVEAQRPIDLAAVVRGMAELEASRAEQAGLTFTITAPEAGVVIEGRQAQLNSLLANLVDNAIKFTPAGGAMTLGLRQEGVWAVLSVADTGIGIPVEDLPQLFSRFHRGRNAAGHPGNGLGLAIVNAIVQGHGGSVTAENTNPGARFVVRLPLTAARQAGQAPAA